MRLRFGCMSVACCDCVSFVELVDFRLLVFDFHNVVSFLKNFNIRLPLPRGGTLRYTCDALNDEHRCL